jgi:hypothetical protein
VVADFPYRSPQQHDIGLAGVDACRELGDRLGLIAARRIFAHDLEWANGSGGLHDSSVGGATDTRAGVRRGHVRRTSTPYAGDMLEFLVGSSLAAAAGLNAWMPLFALGLLDRLLPGFALPNAWSWLSGDVALWIIGTLLVVEIVADKIPAVDSVNDVIQTVVRPASGGIAFGAGVGAQEVADPRGSSPTGPGCRS